MDIFQLDIYQCWHLPKSSEYVFVCNDIVHIDICLCLHIPNMYLSDLPDQQRATIVMLRLFADRINRSPFLRSSLLQCLHPLLLMMYKLSKKMYTLYTIHGHFLKIQMKMSGARRRRRTNWSTGPIFSVRISAVPPSPLLFLIYTS